MKTLITRIKRLALALCLATPIVSWAATSTYSTYSDGTTTPSAGGAYSNHQRFQLNADWMFLADGTDVAASAVAVNLESIAVKWAGSTHSNADIGGNSNPQPDAYLVLTTPQDVIVGISAVNDAKWGANGTSIFAFTDVVVSPNAQYYFYFATDVSGLAVGAAMQSSNKKNGRVLCAYHGSDKASDETVRIGADNKYSINCSFVVSEASATAVTTGAEAVSLATGTDPVVVTGAVADGVVNVAFGAEYPSVTVVGEATTLKLSDSITATYFYLPATTTIDASSVEIGLPGSGEGTKETVLVSGKISAASVPEVTLPELAEGYSYEPLVRDDSSIKAVVSRPVDATVTLDGTEQKWSEVKPEGWVNSALPLINVDNTVAGTLIFDEDVQAARIHTTKGSAVNFVRGDGVSVNIPLFSAAMTYMRVTFTDFDTIPQTNHSTDGNDQITAAGTSTLTSFPQIDASAQGANLVINQPATFTDNGIYVTGSKTVDINSTISTSRIVLGNQSGTTQVVNQNGGSITITGTAGPGNTSASVLLGHWNSTSTFKTLGGTFTANNVASRLGWDGTTTWQIGGGSNPARVNVYGIVNGQNSHTGSGTLNIMANGTLNLGAGGIQFSNSGNGGNINLAGGTIDTGAASVTIANTKTSGTIINQNKTTTVNVDAEKTLTIDAVLSGSGVGTLKKTGAGKLVLAQTATSVGKLLVNAGTVEFNEDVNWSTSGSVEVAADGTLNILTAEDVAEGGLLRAGTFTVTGTVLNNGAEIDVVVKSDGIYRAAPMVSITVPTYANTTVTVKVGDETIDVKTAGNDSNTYEVVEGAAVTVTYAAVAGYEMTGTATYTIDSAEEGSTVTPSITTKQYVAYVVFQEEQGLSFVDVTNYYTTVAAAIDAAKALKKTIVLIAQPDAEDTYAISVGDVINVKKGEFTFDGIVFPTGAQYNNTTTETAGVTTYKCTVNTVTVQYPGQDPVGMTGQLIQILGGLYSGYVPAYAGTIVTVLDESDGTVGDAMPDVFTYNSEAHTYTLKTMVASYNNGYTTTYYPTLAYAVENVPTEGTIVLLADVTLDARVEPAKSMTIDLGKHMIARTGTSGNGSAFDVKSGTVTIKNGWINCSMIDDTDIAADGVYAITSRAGSAVTLEDLEVYVDSECGACAYPFAGSTITIKSGFYRNMTQTPYRYKSEWTGMAVNQPNIATQLLFIEGGSFTQVDPAEGDDSGEVSSFLAEGCVSYNSPTTSGIYKVGAWEARVWEKGYASLEDAVTDAGSSSSEVVLLKDVTLTERIEPSPGGSSMTINLNGHTITRTGTSGNGSAFDVKSGTVTIKNGTIDCTQDDTAIVADGVYAITARAGSAVTLEDLTVTVNSQAGACVYPFAEYMVNYWYGATVTIKSGTYKNLTDSVYQYGRFNEAGLKGMAVNQGNINQQLISIEGGTFGYIDPELGDDSGEMTNFCQTGYIAVPNGDGTYTVREGTWVAKVGDTKFESFDAAVAAAKVSGEQVMILKDQPTGMAEPLVVSEPVTVNYNGHSIYYPTVTVAGGFIIAPEQSFLGVDTWIVQTISDEAPNRIVKYAYGATRTLTLDYQSGDGLVDVTTGDLVKGYAAPYSVMDGAEVTFTAAPNNTEVKRVAAGYPKLKIGDGEATTLTAVDGVYTATVTGGNAVISVEFEDIPATTPAEPGAVSDPVDTQAEAEAAAAKTEVSVPEAVAQKLSEEQKTAYTEMFQPKVVEVKVGETTKYAVEVVMKESVAEAIQEDVDAETADVAAAAVAAASNPTTTPEADVSTTPGLYYVVEAGSSIDGIAPESCTLATGTSLKLKIPNKGTSGFYRIGVSVTPVDVQE